MQALLPVRAVGKAVARPLDGVELVGVPVPRSVHLHEVNITGHELWRRPAMSRPEPF